MSDDSSIETTCFSFVWKIENFSHCLEKTNESLESPPFQVDFLSGTIWRLLLYPRGTDDQSRIAFYLQRQRCDLGPLGITVDFELSFLSPDGTILKMANLNEHGFEVGDGYGIPLFVSRDDVLKAEKDLYLPDDTLTVRCRLWKSHSDTSEPDSDCIARTRIGVEKGSFKWQIRDFSKLPTNKQTSLVVERDSRPDAPMSLVLYLSGGYGTDRKVQIDISLCKVPRECFSTCGVSVLDAKGRVLELSENERWFEATEDEQVWHLRSFLTKNHLMSKNRLYLPNDVLSLQFEFCLSVGVEESVLVESPTCTQSPSPYVQKSSPASKNASIQANTTKTPIPANGRNCVPLRSYTEFTNNFVHDLHCMYDEKLLCDFTFRAGAEIFPVHKCVLGARSPVFRAMFTNELAEHTSDLPLDIPDLDADTMHYLLTFLYTDGVDASLTWEMAYKLYFAADKYAVQSLRERCAALLAQGLRTDNVCRVLMLADMHQDASLRSAALEFVMVNDSEVLRSEEWKSMEEGDVVLAFETMREVYMKKLRI